MVKARVPPIDRRVVPAKRDLEHIALIKPDNGTFDFRIKACRRRRADAGVRPRGKSEFAEKVDLWRQSRNQVHRKLALADATVSPFLIGSGKIDIGKSGHP